MRGNIVFLHSLICGALGALLLFALTAVASPAAETSVPSRSPALTAPLDSPTAPPLAADRLGWLWTLLENTLHTRARMVQFGVVIMCIALYFMFRARG